MNGIPFISEILSAWSTDRWLHTSLNGLVQKAPTTLVHHVHVSFAVHQSGGDTFQFSRKCQVECQITIVVQFIQSAWQLKPEEKNIKTRTLNLFIAEYFEPAGYSVTGNTE